MPADGMRTFPDAGSQAAMVRSLGVRSERGADSGKHILLRHPVVDLHFVQSLYPYAAACSCISVRLLGVRIVLRWMAPSPETVSA